MERFLKKVAKSLRGLYQDDFSGVTIVSPNQRAKLFLNEYLLTEGGQNGTTIWAPQYQTINELFAECSSYPVADSIETICKIYQLYTHNANSNETLDHFWGWGEKILSDFDDIDKNLSPADQVLKNFSELKSLDSFDYIDEEVERTLQKFFSEFSVQGNSMIREKFLEMWKSLLPIYQKLNDTSQMDAFPYEGALYRYVIDGIKNQTICFPKGRTYVFVGFHVLNKSERELFSYLKSENQALFYWDYDVYYAHSQSMSDVGKHALQNLNEFPNPKDFEISDCISHTQNVTCISSPTEMAQVKYATTWMRQQIQECSERDIAIVLCNEDLLLPLLHSIPEEVNHVNITKGYPLTQTLPYQHVYHFLSKFHSDSIDEDISAAKVLELLNEFIVKESRREGNIVKQVNEQESQSIIPELESQTANLLSLSDTSQENVIDLTHDTDMSNTSPKSIDQILYDEAYFLIHTITNRLIHIVEQGLLDVTPQTLLHIFRKVAHSTTIPFHGEPIQGIQIMGVLETRNLHFDRILVLSTNEGRMPQTSNSPVGIIPYHLREAFSLTTPQQHTAIYAYHFYSLLSRCSCPTFAYVNSSESVGERSRFITQIELESDIPVIHKHISHQTNAVLSTLTSITKPSDISKRFKSLSPSAINTYMYCEKSFYYKYVLGLNPLDDSTEGVKPNTFGTLFHYVAQHLYSPQPSEKCRPITTTYLQYLLSEEGEHVIDDLIRKAFQSEGLPYHRLTDVIIKTYIKRLLEMDLKNGDFTILGSELKVTAPFDVNVGENIIHLTLGGSIDRIDSVRTESGEEIVRIIDYKTGGNDEKSFKNWDFVFIPGENHKKYVLQTLIYSYCYTHMFPRANVAPGLIFIHQVSSPHNYQPLILMNKHQLTDFLSIREEFKDKLHDLLAEMLNPSIPFRPTTVERNCKNCHYKNLCKYE